VLVIGEVTFNFFERKKKRIYTDAVFMKHETEQILFMYLLLRASPRVEHNILCCHYNVSPSVESRHPQPMISPRDILVSKYKIVLNMVLNESIYTFKAPLFTMENINVAIYKMIRSNTTFSKTCI
jgi:hypothetical protein